MKNIIQISLAALMLLFLTEAYSQVNRLEYYDFGNHQASESTRSLSSLDKVPDNIRNTNFFRRFDWFYRPRLNEYGVFPKQFIDEQREMEYEKIRVNADNNKSSEPWTNLGPVGVDMSITEVPHWGVISGRIRGLAIHPANPDIVYIGAASGGIWKTTDGGQTWTDKSGDLNMLAFGSIAIDPSNPEVVYAGTGESAWYILYNMYSGDGLYKSVDAGEHWIKIGSDLGSVTHFSDIVISPHNPNLIMATLATSDQIPSLNQGI